MAAINERKIKILKWLVSFGLIISVIKKQVRENVMARKMKKYEDDLMIRLKDQDYAVEYLNAVLEDKGDDQQERFLMALKDIAKAHGVANVASESEVTREALYRTLSEKGNPEFSTLLSVLSALGLKIMISADKAS